MKIKIVDVDYVTDDESLTLRECGFEIGDIVEVSGKYSDGDFSVKAIRETEFVNVGNEISVSEFECEVVE